MAMAQLEIYKKLYLKDREIKNLIVIDDYISPYCLTACQRRCQQDGHQYGRICDDIGAVEK